MRSGLLCAIPFDKKKLVKGFLYIRALLVAGILLFGLPAIAQPIVAGPVVDSGTSPTLTICAHTPIDITAWLAVTDPLAVTWHLVTGPSHGTLTGLATDQTSASGGHVSPGTPVIYTPDTSLTDFITVNITDGNGSVDVNFVFNVNPTPALALTNNSVPVCAGSTSASLAYTNLVNAGPGSDTFYYSGQEVSWRVPVGVSSLNFDVRGARGGRQNATPPVYLPGNGARVQGMLNVSWGEPLYLFVGGVGGDGTPTGAAGGFNGGGGTSFYLYGSGGGGGGASDIRVGDDGLFNRVVVAGGGGGDGWDSSGTLSGGAGGGLTGANSALNGGIAPTNFAGGGTQSAGGAGAHYPGWLPGMDGVFGIGGNGSAQGISGGGGGGYYGGGGGVWTGGGGGSSYAAAGSTAGITYTSGFDTTNGIIIFNYDITSTYTIVWDGLGHAAGFNDITAALPVSSIPLTVPATAPPAVYSGTLTVTNATCTSPVYTFSVTVNAIPTVNPIVSQTVCNGDSTIDINFNGEPGTVTFNWVSSNPDFGLSLIGLSTIGTGHIGKFPPVNTTTAPVIDTFVVTPTANGCIGVPQTFTITDNPIPVLNSTLFPPAICDSAAFTYIQNSLTVGTTYTWSRADITGLVNADTTGSGDINEVLVNTTNSVIPVVYMDTLNFAGCINVQAVTVNIYPFPVLTSSLSATICSGITFDYSVFSSFEGTELTWSRATVSGISNTASSGGGDISETLIDTTVNPVAAVYVYTLSVNAGSCNYTQNVTVTVNPTPRLLSVTMTPVCDSMPLSFISASATAGTTFAWSRDIVAGITNPAKSDTGAAINDTLVNNTPLPIVVIYADTLMANSCINVQYLTDTVYPNPTLNSTLRPDSICSNTVFTYLPGSNTPGTTFAWGRDSIVGISESAATGLDSVVEILVNTTHGIIPVTYVYTLTANSCMNIQNVVVNVNPLPMLSSTLTASPICDSMLFSYVPVGATTGSIFTWTRAYVPGIDKFPGSGADSVHENLINSTYINVEATYVFSITANGCGNTENVTVIVHPTPRLSSDSSDVVCSGSVLNYYPSSYTPTTTFAWSAATVAGVTPTGNSGTGNINETVTSTLDSSANIVFLYTLTAYTCPHNELVTVKVNPAPAYPGITIHPSSSLCDNTMYQNFGVAVPPPAGMSYNWFADNGYVWAIGNDGQYALVNFITPGITTVSLIVANNTTGCESNNSFQVNVGTSSSINPEVIYYASQFICKDADVDNYQWGYDDAVTFDSTIIVGENNQNYYNPHPDTANKYYWVITNHGGCSQKSYFNTPRSTTGIVYVNKSEAGMKVYPNPAAQDINVELYNTAGGDIRIDVTNMLGQKISSANAVNNMARIEVAALPAGCYMVDCYRDGAKVASAKFIKN